jgi:hypothetical protein
MCALTQVQCTVVPDGRTVSQRVGPERGACYVGGRRLGRRARG